MVGEVIWILEILRASLTIVSLPSHSNNYLPKHFDSRQWVVLGGSSFDVWLIPFLVKLECFIKKYTLTTLGYHHVSVPICEALMTVWWSNFHQLFKAIGCQGVFVCVCLSFCLFVCSLTPPKWLTLMSWNFEVWFPLGCIWF